MSEPVVLYEERGSVAIVTLMLAWPMLPAAAAAECDDALDALQRVYAYLTGKLLRLLLYGLILLALGAFAYLVAAWLMSLALNATAGLSGAWTGVNAATLTEGGDTMMPPDGYGFSRRFAWVSDRFGVSWQLNAA